MREALSDDPLDTIGTPSVVEDEAGDGAVREDVSAHPEATATAAAGGTIAPEEEDEEEEEEDEVKIEQEESPAAKVAGEEEQGS